MKQNYKDFSTGNANAMSADDSFRIAVSGVPVDCVLDLENYAWIYMRRAHNLLKKARAVSGNDYDRKKIDYVISVAESAMGL